jgi:hypothetical protein
MSDHNFDWKKVNKHIETKRKAELDADLWLAKALYRVADCIAIIEGRKANKEILCEGRSYYG